MNLETLPTYSKLPTPIVKQTSPGAIAFRRAQSGATMIEFAMIAGAVFLFIIGGIDLVRFGFFTVTTQQVLNRAARQASVGTAGDNFSKLKRNPEERAQDIAASIVTIGRNFGLDLSEGTVDICPIPGPNPAVVCPPNNAGRHSDFITIVLHQPFHFVWQAWTYNLNLHAIAKNEPF